MRVAIGSDHRGVDWRRRTGDYIASLGIEVVDVGGKAGEPVDYPDVAANVAQQVASKQCERGVLFCGTGIGMAIAANKVRGIRAAVCHDRYTAEMSRRHNDANVICLSADRLTPDEVFDIVKHWLTTDFEGGRHQLRVDKIAKLEQKNDRHECGPDG